jgi:hypothetical protein
MSAPATVWSQQVSGGDPQEEEFVLRQWDNGALRLDVYRGYGRNTFTTLPHAVLEQIVAEGRRVREERYKRALSDLLLAVSKAQCKDSGDQVDLEHAAEFAQSVLDEEPGRLSADDIDPATGRQRGDAEATP